MMIEHNGKEYPFPSCPWPRRSSRRWLIVGAEYRREKLAAKSIEADGYLVYQPLYTVKVRDRSKHRRWVQVQRPLFGSFLFVEAKEGEISVSGIETARGVRSIMRVGDNLARVPDVLIEEMRRDEKLNFGKPYKAKAVAPFKAGERVRITDGPFASFYAIVQGVVTGYIDGEAGITALASLFGREVKISGLTADQVTRA